MMAEGSSFMGVKLDSGKGAENVKVFLLQWSHFCLVVTQSYTQMFVDGNFVFGYNKTRERQDEFHVSFGGNIGSFLSENDIQFPDERTGENIGSFHVENEDEFQGGGSYAGDVVNPEVWIEVLPVKDIQDVLSKCLNLSIEPRSSNWKVMGSSVTPLFIAKDIPCTEQKFDYVVLPNKLTFVTNNERCKQYGMTTVTPKTNNNYDALVNSLRVQNTTCFNSGGVRGWLQPLHAPSLEQNCLGITDRGRVKDVSCYSRLCGLCQFLYSRATFYLRGLCSIQEQDLSFHVEKHDDDSSIYFQGIYGHVIVMVNNSWQLKSSKEGIILAELNSPNVIGTKPWRIRSSICDKYEDTEVEASFNSCNKHKSWCSSGHCIAANRRCNSLIDCDDESDEENCKSFSSMRSAAMTSTNSLPKETVDVLLRVEVLRIYQADDCKPIQAVIKYRMIWRDTETVFANINQDSPTLIAEETSPKFWTPELMPTGSPPDPRDCIGEECGDPMSISAYTSNSPMPDSRESPIGGKSDAC